MNKLRFVVSLTTRDNDYQVEQAAVAAQTKRSANSGRDIPGARFL
jgi:hypothetical protein